MFSSGPGLLGGLIIGALVGALAGRLVSGHGYGCLANTAIGLAGAFIGAVILYRLLPANEVLLTGDLAYGIVSFLGAVILLVVVRLVSHRR